MNTNAAPVLVVRHAEKRFGAVHALRDVSVDVHQEQVLALLGDNGAGKSTLIKCISGVHTLDGGEILLDGKQASLHTPAAAAKLRFPGGFPVVCGSLAAVPWIAKRLPYLSASR